MELLKKNKKLVIILVILLILISFKCNENLFNDESFKSVNSKSSSHLNEEFQNNDSNVVIKIIKIIKIIKTQTHLLLSTN